MRKLSFITMLFMIMAGCLPCQETISELEYRKFHHNTLKVSSTSSNAKFRVWYYAYNTSTGKNELVGGSEGKLVEINGDYATVGGDGLKAVALIEKLVNCDNHAEVYETKFYISQVSEDVSSSYFKIENLSDGDLELELYAYGKPFEKKYLLYRIKLGKGVTKDNFRGYEFSFMADPNDEPERL